MKSKNKILFRLVAYTDAAGKFNENAVRNGNEDNFYIDDDLTDDITNRAAQDEAIQLGKLGMLMVIADGMGGMNAGEVASQIAVDTVKAAFTTESLTDTVIATSQSRQKYLEHVIKNADKNIKLDSKKIVAIQEWEVPSLWRGFLMTSYPLVGVEIVGHTYLMHKQVFV